MRGRVERLNCALETLIRKTNKAKLSEIKKEWELKYGKKRKITAQSTVSPSTIHGDDKDNSTLESIIRCIVQRQSSDMQQVIAVTLHESSINELPCWDDDGHDTSCSKEQAESSVSRSRDSRSIQICFFLGAVRDMYKTENSSLRRVCDSNNIPLLRIRLGPVSEFTSKILTVVAYHDTYHRLVPACLLLILRNQKKLSSSSLEGVDTSQPSTTLVAKPLVLHYLCHVPDTSDCVSTDLKDRNRILWCMIRCTVTSLWRSRFASGKSNHTHRNHGHHSTSLRNRLSFIFNDGIVLTLEQIDLVTDMAEKHQAAPSEYQVLLMLRQKLDALRHSQQPTSSLQKKSSFPTMMRDLFFDTETKTVQPPTFCIDFLDDNSLACNNYFYSSGQCKTSTTCLFDKGNPQQSSLVIAIIISLSANTDTLTITNMAKLSERSDFQSSFRKACAKEWTNFTTIIPGRALVNVDCIDQEATFITMTQHLAYQGRILNLCDRYQEVLAA
jgi:hypothetical protein